MTKMPTENAENFVNLDSAEAAKVYPKQGTIELRNRIGSLRDGSVMECDTL